MKFGHELNHLVVSFYFLLVFMDAYPSVRVADRSFYKT